MAWVNLSVDTQTKQCTAVVSTISQKANSGETFGLKQSLFGRLTDNTTHINIWKENQRFFSELIRDSHNMVLPQTFPYAKFQILPTHKHVDLLVPQKPSRGQK